MRWPVPAPIRTWTARRREIRARVRGDLQGSAEASPAAALGGASAVNAGFKVSTAVYPSSVNSATTLDFPVPDMPVISTRFTG